MQLRTPSHIRAHFCRNAKPWFLSEESYNLLRRLVGAWRFELQTSCAQGRRATRLRYAPTCECIVDSKVGLDIRSSYIHRAGAVSRTNCTRHDEMTPVLSFYVVARSTQGGRKV